MKESHFMQDLSAIRRNLLKKRKSLSFDECKKAGEGVLKNILALDLLKNNEDTLNIALYSAMPGEIPTLDIFLKLRSLGHKIAYPLVESTDGGLMNFYEVEDLDDLHAGAYGILEPECNDKRLIKPQCLNIMLIPLVGFDKYGNRLGMGGGFYDRFLKNLNCQCRKIGIAHDFQEIDCIKVRAWDMPLDEIITPTRYLKFKK